MRRPLFAAWLVVAWVLLWGRLSWANVLSGLAVVALLLVVVPIGGGAGRRPSCARSPSAGSPATSSCSCVRANVTLTRDDPERRATVCGRAWWPSRSTT